MLSLATSPATPRQRSQVFAIAGVLSAAWLLLAFVSSVQFTGIDLGWVLVVAQLMTAYLLFSQLFQQRSPAIALIAAAFVFTFVLYNLPVFWLSAKIVHPTSFMQTARAHAWLGVFTHAGFPLFFLSYALFDNYLEHIKLSIAKAFTWAAAMAAGVFVGCVLLGMAAIAFESPLSGFFGVQGVKVYAAPAVSLTVLAIAVVSLAAFVWATRLYTLTQTWLALSLFAAILDIAILALVQGNRFTVGWSVAQLFGIISCVAIPALYVFEFHWMYERLHVVSEIIHHTALMDELTGLGNRRSFDVEIDLEWRRAMRTGAPVSVILVDIDNAQPYLDARGGPALEDLVRKLAGDMRKYSRRARDFVARFDDTTFAVLFPDQSAGKAIEFARAIERTVETLALEHPANPPRNIVTVTASASTTVPAMGRPVTSFVEQAVSGLASAHSHGERVGMSS